MMRSLKPLVRALFTPPLQCGQFCLRAMPQMGCCTRSARSMPEMTEFRHAHYA